ncbi:hypothetical protein COCON_G00049940 [Conger conger]|uniref:Uncharacterized protein n=1 Tax=Conger conger TaxID=82655 RepID=A0A9Q1DV85_CONCO|nr:leukemia-associated protein 7 [Conger conger]KAJ8282475.1 hypothetical protein COCON_G00049940 [Conger conger]
MQVGATIYNSMEHQVEALKFLKKVHFQEIANGNSSIELRGDDRGGSEKEKAGLDSNSSVNHVCGRSNLKNDSDSTTGVSTRRAVRTIAERARDSIFSRLTEIAYEIISVEEELCRSAPKDQSISLHPKDSIELRNICARISASDAGCLSERDLKELGHCLRRIVDSLLCSFTHNCLAVTKATNRLRGICDIFPDF